MLLSPRPLLRHLRLAAGLASLAGCTQDLIAPGGGEQITISGTLINKTNQPLPSGTRVLVAWEVSSGSPDYMYVFGEGTIQEASNSFTLSFDGPPPARALNSYGLGVGIIFLTTNTSLKEGSDPQGIPELEIVGAAGQHSVIYLDRNPAEFGTNMGWVSRFKRGYNVGKGIDLPGTFDGFEPTSPSAVEILIDALRNINFVNWT
jgi:hypothetical protein